MNNEYYIKSCAKLAIFSEKNKEKTLNMFF